MFKETTELKAKPIKVGNITATPVAKVSRFSLSLAGFAVFQGVARPTRVEVEGAGGALYDVPIRDLDAKIRLGIRACTIAATLALTLRRRRSR